MRSFAAQAMPRKSKAARITNDGSGENGAQYRPPWQHGKKSFKWKQQRALVVKENNAMLKAGRSLEEILDSLGQLKQSGLSPINVATILSKLLKFQAALNAKLPQQEAANLKAVNAQLMAHVSEGARGYPASTLAFCITSLRKLHVRLSDSLLKAAEAEVQRRPLEFPIQDIARLAVIQAVAKKGFHKEVCDEAERRIAQPNAEQIPQSFLIDIAWAFASSGRLSAVVFGALHASVANSSEAFSGTELTTALWACGAVGEVTPQLHRAVIDRVLEDPAAFKAPQLASILRVSSTSLGAPEELLEAVMPLLKDAASNLKPQQLTFVIAAYAKAKQHSHEASLAAHSRRSTVLADEQFCRFYDALEASGLKQMQAFRSETLALFLSATVDLRGAAAARRTLLSAKGIHALRRLGANLPELSPHGLACALRTLEQLARADDDKSYTMSDESRSSLLDAVQAAEIVVADKAEELEAHPEDRKVAMSALEALRQPSRLSSGA